jgi:hypothetical protein
MSTRHTINSSNPEVRLIVNAQRMTKNIPSADVVKPAELADAVRMAMDTWNNVYLAVVGGKVTGKPTVQEIKINDCNLRDGRTIVNRLEDGQFQIIVEVIAEAEVLRNGSVARSVRAVYQDGKWIVAN